MLFVNVICDLWLVGRVIVLRDYSYCISFKVINGMSELSHAYVNWNACRYIGRYAECMLIIFGHISRRLCGMSIVNRIHYIPCIKLMVY